MRLRLLAATIAVLASSLAAHADTLFSFSLNSQNFSFSLPNSAQPTFYDPGNYAEYDNVSISVNGSSTNQDIVFWSNSNLGGFILQNSLGVYQVDQAGSQLYTGSELAPAFTLGTFQLVDNDDAVYSGDATLTIASTSTPAAIPVAPSATAVTPEPSSLALLGTGLLGVAGAVRRRLVA